MSVLKTLLKYNIKKYDNYINSIINNNVLKYFNSYNSNNYVPSLQLNGIDNNNSNNNIIDNIFDLALWFAAPKSKISPRRKRRKHLRYHPKRVNWIRCNKCGEAKLPHRICTTHKEICGMRDDEWMDYLAQQQQPEKQQKQQQNY